MDAHIRANVHPQGVLPVKQSVGRPDDSLHHHGTEHVRTKDAEKRNGARSGLRKDAIVAFRSPSPHDCVDFQESVAVYSLLETLASRLRAARSGDTRDPDWCEVEK